MIAPSFLVAVEGAILSVFCLAGERGRACAAARPPSPDLALLARQREALGDARVLRLLGAAHVGGMRRTTVARRLIRGTEREPCIGIGGVLRHGLPRQGDRLDRVALLHRAPRLCDERAAR